ncbi:MAG: NAD(P)/FAD-dependent oxidoreductase [Ferruginibacter sp.]
MATPKKLVVIGGGAAGFFCAVNAGANDMGLEILLLEQSSKLLSKVKISGGGRCNVTHACFSMAEMLKKYPRGSSFLKKAFYQFFTTDTIQWFKERGILLKTEADGRMFPESNSSQTIIDCLLKEASKTGVKIQMNAGVKKIEKKNNQPFLLTLANGSTITADAVCIACGGFPKSSQFEWLTEIGHHIIEPVPSLFTFNIPNDPITALMGISVDDAVVKIEGTTLQQQGPMLITHWGLSGPAVLKLSAWAARHLAIKNYEYQILVNWLPFYNENSLREKIQEIRFNIASQKIVNRNPFTIPSRLWEYFLAQCVIDPNSRWADLPAKQQNKLIKILCAQQLLVKGKTTFKEEFVTAGGIDISEVNHQTMESKIVPGLFFAGEILNIDGVTGGFNFQNAWTTGFIAAKGVVSSFATNHL